MSKKIIFVVVLLSLPFIFMARARQKANDAQIPNAQVLKTYTPWATIKIDQVEYDVANFIGKSPIEALKTIDKLSQVETRIDEMLVNDLNIDIPTKEYVIKDRDRIEWK